MPSWNGTALPMEPHLDQLVVRTTTRPAACCSRASISRSTGRRPPGLGDDRRLSRRCRELYSSPDSPGPPPSSPSSGLPGRRGLKPSWISTALSKPYLPRTLAPSRPRMRSARLVWARRRAVTSRASREVHRLLRLERRDSLGHLLELREILAEMREVFDDRRAVFEQQTPTAVSRGQRPAGSGHLRSPSESALIPCTSPPLREALGRPERLVRAPRPSRSAEVPPRRRASLMGRDSAL